jgi:periplasmic protein TonB
MKHTLLIILLLILSANLKSQSVDTIAKDIKTSVNDSIKKNENTPVSHVEILPEFPGGEEALYKYLSKNIKYPKEASKNNITGKVDMRFLIDSLGNTRMVTVIKSSNPIFEEEATRLIQSLPKWKPGTVDGIPVNVFYRLTIKFSI